MHCEKFKLFMPLEKKSNLTTSTDSYNISPKSVSQTQSPLNEDCTFEGRAVITIYIIIVESFI